MKSMNLVLLLGHLATDVDFRQTKNGHSVASFPVATNRIVNGSGNEKKEIVDYHRIVAWGKLGEICDKYLSKGLAVQIQGYIANRSFEDKNKEKHYRTEIVANDINIITWKKSSKGKEEITLKPIDDKNVEIVEDDE